MTLIPLIPLIPLRAPDPTVRHPSDVARLRKILNDRGFDAGDGDIQRAYADWSEELWWAGWMSMDDWTDDYLFDVLRGLLKADGDSDGETAAQGED